MDTSTSSHGRHARSAAQGELPRTSSPEGQPGNCQGVAAVEFAFVLPLLLALVLGTATLGHAVLVRFLMHSAAYDAARTCALARQTSAACASSVVKAKLNDTAMKWCDNFQLTTADPIQPGLPTVNTFEVRLSCSFIGGVGTNYLKKHGLSIANIRARAAMPH